MNLSKQQKKDLQGELHLWFRQWLVYARIDNQAALARHLSINPTAVSRWITRISVPRRRLIQLQTIYPLDLKGYYKIQKQFIHWST